MAEVPVIVMFKLLAMLALVGLNATSPVSLLLLVLASVGMDILTKIGNVYGFGFALAEALTCIREVTKPFGEIDVLLGIKFSLHH